MPPPRSPRERWELNPPLKLPHRCGSFIQLPRARSGARGRSMPLARTQAQLFCTSGCSSLGPFLMHRHPLHPQAWETGELARFLPSWARRQCTKEPGWGRSRHHPFPHPEKAGSSQAETRSRCLVSSALPPGKQEASITAEPVENPAPWKERARGHGCCRSKGLNGACEHTTGAAPMPPAWGCAGALRGCGAHSSPHCIASEADHERGHTGHERSCSTLLGQEVPGTCPGGTFAQSQDPERYQECVQAEARGGWTRPRARKPSNRR